MLDLRRNDEFSPPWHWRQAPLPGAPLYLAGRAGLHRFGHNQAEPASPALLAALEAAAEPGTVIAAEDSAGTQWRLLLQGKAGDHPGWQLQELGESRRRLRLALRHLLAPRLSDGVLHELRNPLNALSLHTDLIGRFLAVEGGSTDRVNASLDVIKQRLRDLGERQNATMALWLEDAAAEPAEPAAVGPRVEACLKLARGYLSLREVRLRSQTLQPLEGLQLSRHGTTLQLALLTLLLIAGAGAEHNRAADGSANVLLLAEADGDRVALELQSAVDGEALGREAADTDGAGLLASLAFLLEPAGIELDAQPAQALLRLVFPAR